MAQLFPVFRVFETQGVGADLHLFGTVSATTVGRETWVGDGYLGYLFRGRPLLYGRWHSAGGGWKFSVSEVLHKSDEDYKGQEIDVLDGYWGERAELVLDERLEWAERLFDKDSDHVHCAICWATISSKAINRYMTCAPHTKVCLECYTAYVKPRSLAFIEPNKG